MIYIVQTTKETFRFEKMDDHLATEENLTWFVSNKLEQLATPSGEVFIKCREKEALFPILLNARHIISVTIGEG